ncbi:hypothetical protein VII00023_01805 [Vibrio ichthyoenteri ATCC 700023]|uniref:MORN repeat-containing protein n=2 Tax=Vibrio ichthyoenteri TaxID=142461 RepID=F9S4U4_9VIBR|nr:hypothetical protein VII00023_01805 [Vibrio ichthyoenteri ATCC 700023]
MHRIYMSLAFLIALLTLSSSLAANTTETDSPIWLDDDWNIVKTEAQARYYLAQPLAEKQGVWPVTVYFQGGNIVNFKGTFNSGDISTGKSVGEYEIYHDNGHLLSTGSRNAKGQYEGLTRLYNDEGVLTQEATFVAGKEEGVGRRFYPSGAVEEEYTILGGERVGEDVHYYEDGNVWQRHRFIDGKAHGIQKTFYRDGSLRQLSTRAMGQRQGEHTNYYENGQISYQVTYLNDQPTGVALSYQEDGVLQLEVTFKNGKKNGLERSWYGQDQLRSERHNVDGKAHGVVTHYYDSGNTKSVENYVEGRRQGRQLTFYDLPDVVKSDSQINEHRDKTAETRFDEHGVMTYQYVATYHEKQRSSDEKKYRDSSLVAREQTDTKRKWRLNEKFDKHGKLIQRIEKVNGKYHNAYVTLDTYRDNLETTHYQNGVRSGKYSVVSLEGNLIDNGTYFKGKKTGVWQHRYNGLTRSESYNRKGQLHGEVSEVDANGKRLTWEHYRNGKQHGYTENYAKTGALLAKGKYLNDLREGQWQHQEEYEFDVVIWSGKYRKGKKVGKWFAHSAAGYELGRQQYDQQGRKQGAFYIFEEHGALKRIEHYKDDEPVGEFEYYGTDGQIYQSQESASITW